eukprot:7403600-Pyramimonas_sp.AAC.1
MVRSHMEHRRTSRHPQTYFLRAPMDPIGSILRVCDSVVDPIAALRGSNFPCENTLDPLPPG